MTSRERTKLPSDQTTALTQRPPGRHACPQKFIPYSPCAISPLPPWRRASRSSRSPAGSAISSGTTSRGTAHRYLQGMLPGFDESDELTVLCEQLPVLRRLNRGPVGAHAREVLVQVIAAAREGRPVGGYLEALGLASSPAPETAAPEQGSPARREARGRRLSRVGPCSSLVFMSVHGRSAGGRSVARRAPACRSAPSSERRSVSAAIPEPACSPGSSPTLARR